MSTHPLTAVLLLGLLVGCGAESSTTAADPSPSTSTSDSASPTAPSSATTSGTPSSTGSTQISPSASPSSPTAAPSTRRARNGTTVVTGASDYGTVLFDSTGQAVYLFDVEDTSRPRCYGPCAEAWPPVLTQGVPRAGTGVDQSLLGTTRRDGGGTQVTYDGHPLYYYAHEGKDEVRCHDVFLDGGNWYAVQPNGRRAP